MGIFQKNQVEYDDELNIAHELIKTLLYIGLIVALVFVVLTYVGSRSEVSGYSMENTLHDGESIWIDKLTYRFKDPERYDIVVFPFQDSGTYFIKRIIGLPGETIYIDEEGAIYIGTEETIYEDEDGIVHVENATCLDEDYGAQIIEKSNRGLASEPVTLGADEYFVMGDNRNNSKDSRDSEVGPISKSQIKGKATICLWPLNRIGKIDK